MSKTNGWHLPGGSLQGLRILLQDLSQPSFCACAVVNVSLLLLAVLRTNSGGTTDQRGDKNLSIFLSFVVYSRKAIRILPKKSQYLMYIAEAERAEESRS